MVADVLEALESRYPASLAADWDAIGLVCGDPRAPVRRILVAVDPVLPVAQEASEVGADLLVTHHPLFLRPVHSVAATSAKGRIVHTLISRGIALTCAHTNADHATGGVSDALAMALGLSGLRPLDPLADPRTGTGRVGTLADPVTLEQFAEHVAAVLPETEHGVRVAGDPMAVIETVAVCGGAGDSLLDLAAAQADAYVTSDLRHHRAQDHLAQSACALVDVAHWAGEWPWLEVLAGALREDLACAGSSVEVLVSTTPTDPWTLHVPGPSPRLRSRGVAQ